MTEENIYDSLPEFVVIPAASIMYGISKDLNIVEVELLDSTSCIDYNVNYKKANYNILNAARKKLIFISGDEERTYKRFYEMINKRREGKR